MPPPTHPTPPRTCQAGDTVLRLHSWQNKWRLTQISRLHSLPGALWSLVSFFRVCPCLLRTVPHPHENAAAERRSSFSFPLKRQITFGSISALSWTVGTARGAEGAGLRGSEGL